MGVLLIDWQNLAGALQGRGKAVEASHVRDLWQFANGRTKTALLAHMADVRFDSAIETAMREHDVKSEGVRTTKEQADILLTVLAMDYLHAGERDFVLATGDQDFVHLINRLRRDGAQVTVVYGDPAKLSPELSRTLANLGVENVDFAEISQLNDRTLDRSCRGLLALFELDRRGLWLGGAENGTRADLLAEWGILRAGDHSGYWALVEGHARKVMRYNAAKGVANGRFVPENRQRTYVEMTPTRSKELDAVDFLLRLISSRTRPVSITAMRAGPFVSDRGELLDEALDALLALRKIRRHADGTYEVEGGPQPLGYIEELWRVHTALAGRTFESAQRSLPYNKLQPLVQGGGVGEGPAKREARRASAAVKYAYASGVIDAIAEDDRRHAVGSPTQMCQPIERAYGALIRQFGGAGAAPVSENEVLDFMGSVDDGLPVPTFGWDRRDRFRVLRVLGQARLVGRKDGQVAVADHAWGRALVGATAPRG